MPKIKILAIPSDTHGVGKYRIINPYKYIGDNLSEEIHVDITYNADYRDDYFYDYDVVVFHSFIHQLDIESNLNRINWLRSNNKKVVMDIDDLWFVDHRHPMFLHVKENKIGEQKIRLLKSVDYISTTTPIFADFIKKRLDLKNVVIFPNAVDENEKQFKSDPIKSDKIRFGWLGGSSHLYDIELLENGVSSMHNMFKDKIQFVLCGFDLRGTVTEINKQTNETIRRPIRPDETVWSKYESIFTDKYKVVDEEYKNFLFKFVEAPYHGEYSKPYVRRWTKDINTYATNYNYFDVSLAPLVESVFNSCKSQLKVIEAGFHKKAIIASEVVPYTIDLKNAINEGKFNNDGNALLVSSKKNHKQWFSHMKKLAENPNMIEDLGHKLYETVKDTYSLKKVAKDIVEFYKSIINK